LKPWFGHNDVKSKTEIAMMQLKKSIRNWKGVSALRPYFVGFVFNLQKVG